MSLRVMNTIGSYSVLTIEGFGDGIDFLKIDLKGLELGKLLMIIYKNVGT